ncbi:MAG TPA: DEAD/DEAH box helicase family protein [Solirubrobacteraceae bacterium]|jgi:superfamily II DNA or RNA helicase
MAESTQVALAAAPIPSSADIARAEKLVRERFLHDGEDAAVVLAPGCARRRALDAALKELDQQAKHPSTAWRREFSLLLGLERVLSDEEPRLRDGTLLSAHQVDALSGTLTALLAEAERSAGNGNGNGSGSGNGRAAATIASPELLASASILGPDGDTAPSAPRAPTDGVAAERAAERARRDEEAEEEADARHSGGQAGELEDLEAEEDEDEEDGLGVAPSAADDEDEGEDLGDIEDELEPLPSEDEDDAEVEAESEDEPQDWVDDEDEEEALPDQPEDPNAAKRFWFEHATGAGKTVAALGFVEASQTGGVLILTHRRNLVDQFIGELRQRGYTKRISRPLYVGEDSTKGPVTVETYQWFVRNAGRISSAYTIVICDEAHTALGEKTSGAIRQWTGPIFVGMTATGALIARHVTDLFPTQTSRFDLAQAARRGVIAPLRCVRISPGAGVRTIAKVPLRRGEVDTEFDQEQLAELLDQQPFNLAMANLYKTRFNGVPGVVYAAGVRHAYNLAEAFRAEGIKAQGVSGETPKRELANVLARYERGEIDVLINAQLLAEGWNSPRATVCVHLAPTASKRIYQQRVGRVTRRHPGKEAGLVVDFVHPATKHDDPVVTLHSLLDRDVYRGGAIVVGPVRRGRGRRMRVERRVLPVCSEEERRFAVFERELWRIAVENLDYGEQHVWAALAGARVTPNGWRRARAMLHFDRTGELRSRYLITAVQRNPSAQLRLRALADIAAGRDAEAFDTAIDVIGSWSRDERREAAKIMLRALVERRIGRRDQASAWIWRLAEYTRELHEEYAVQRWPETKRLLGLLVNSSGGAHARNARRLIHASRKQDRRLAAALLAAALAHTPEAEEALRGARTRMARKPPALARELLRNFPKRRARANKRRRKGPKAGAAVGRPANVAQVANEQATEQSSAPVAAPASSPDAAQVATRTRSNGKVETDVARDSVDAAQAVRAAAERAAQARGGKPVADGRGPARDAPAAESRAAGGEPEAKSSDGGVRDGKQAAPRKPGRKATGTKTAKSKTAKSGEAERAEPGEVKTPAAKKAATKTPATKTPAGKADATKTAAATRTAAAKASSTKPAVKKPRARKAATAKAGGDKTPGDKTPVAERAGETS